MLCTGGIYIVRACLQKLHVFSDFRTEIVCVLFQLHELHVMSRGGEELDHLTAVPYVSCM